MINNILANNTRDSLMGAWIQYLSFSSMKELRNNEALFLKHYINYEFDNWVYVATIIWKSCHFWVEHFLQDEQMRKLYAKDPETTMSAVIKNAQQYAKDDYITKNKKPDDFWNSKTMIAFWWYDDIFKLVNDYKKVQDEKDKLNVFTEMQIKDKEIEEIWEKIKKAISKHKKKDEKLDDFIKYGTTWSIEKILEGIEMWLKNWFAFVYPKVKNWKLISAEYNQTLDIFDLDWVVLDLPVKFIVDAVFEDEDLDLIIVDWKFKGLLSSDETIKPEYDMQWSTYFFWCFTAFEKRPKKALIIEIQPSDPKPPTMYQPELRSECDKNDIDWAKWNGWKYMTNAMMQDALLEKWVIELKPVVYEYIIDFDDQSYLLDMWLIFYKQTIKRLYQLLVEKDDFMPNIFDQSFDWGITVYQEWIAQFKPKETAEYTEDDVVDL